MCYNCEGEVDLDVIVCPYCAADLREEKPEQKAHQSSQAPSTKNLDTQASLYPSQYAQRPSKEEEPSAAVHVEEESKGSYGPVILLSLASQLLILGFFMLAFSSKGVLILKWDARFWYFYVLTSIPLFIFGIKALNKL